jgi:hypothetical protein
MSLVHEAAAAGFARTMLLCMFAHPTMRECVHRTLVCWLAAVLRRLYGAWLTLLRDRAHERWAGNALSEGVCKWSLGCQAGGSQSDGSQPGWWGRSEGPCCGLLAACLVRLAEKVGQHPQHALCSLVTSSSPQGMRLSHSGALQWPCSTADSSTSTPSGGPMHECTTKIRVQLAQRSSLLDTLPTLGAFRPPSAAPPAT